MAEVDPAWPSYKLTPGPKGEPLAYVVHPIYYRRLLLAAETDLPSAERLLIDCRGLLDVCRSRPLEDPTPTIVEPPSGLSGYVAVAALGVLVGVVGGVWGWVELGGVR